MKKGGITVCKNKKSKPSSARIFVDGVPIDLIEMHKEIENFSSEIARLNLKITAMDKKIDIIDNKIETIRNLINGK